MTAAITLRCFSKTVRTGAAPYMGHTDMTRAVKQPMTMAFRLFLIWRLERIIHGRTVKANSVRMLTMWKDVQNPVMLMHFWPSKDSHGCGRRHWKATTRMLETVQRQIKAPTPRTSCFWNIMGVRLLR